MRRNQTLCFGEVHCFLGGLFDGDLHAKRILSLTNATLGVIKTASLAVNTIGQGLALARGLASMRSSRWTGCCPTRGHRRICSKTHSKGIVESFPLFPLKAFKKYRFLTQLR
jgi:hypothetical protein